ncbi:MAG TPA: MerR family transcriptional regulator [Chitinophagaceae bacterium]|nr:MerR family transcriptional regulator [Chitinophagaceae bacterium]
MAKPLTQTSIDFAQEKRKENLSAKTPVMIAEEKLMERKNKIVQKPETTAGIKKIKPASTRGRRSLKDMDITSDLIQIPEDEILFQKQYYSIGEVAIMFRENQSLIRYWETEFDILQPRKNRKGDRFFRPVDIKNLVLIYDLLRRRKFTIEGAKDYLKKNSKVEEKFAAVESLKKLSAFLLELKANL